MDPTFALSFQNGTRSLNYKLSPHDPNGIEAQDMPAEITHYQYPLRPEAMVATYLTRDGAPWALDRVTVVARRIRRDGTVNPAAAAHNAVFRPGNDYYERCAPLWLRTFVADHRVPPPLAPAA
ncbi:hypothetical protein [Streptacidiphilus sp. EB103A]|uniref:hypothetical protein n=1 Tax=Streptacidiphilus sp. EB103A TaxID=3156275 RepID=UPI003513D7B4